MVTPPLLFQNGPVKKERSSSSSSSFTSSFSFSSRPFSFSQSTCSVTPSSSGAAGGGLLSVGRRLAMAMELHSRPAGSASSPPPPPPSSPAPPLPPRVKGELQLWLLYCYICNVFRCFSAFICCLTGKKLFVLRSSSWICHLLYQTFQNKSLVHSR